MAEFNTVYVILISMVTMIGILSSTFTVAVNLLDWVKGRILNTCDRILLAIGTSSTVNQCLLVGHPFVYVKLSEDYSFHFAYRVLSQFLIWTVSTNCWLTAGLCVFYCVKIVDFNHRLFIRLKLRISKMVPWLLLGSVVGSLVLCFPAYWFVNTDLVENTANVTSNSSAHSDSLEQSSKYSRLCYFFGMFLPLLFAMASVTLILTSLCRHTRRMREKTSGFSKPQKQAHFGAARVVGALLLIHGIVLLAVCVVSSSASDRLKIIWKIVMVASVSAQSVILILGNTKLKQVLWKVLCLCRTLHR